MPNMAYGYPLAVPTFGKEEIDAATEVLLSGRTIMGDRVKHFEESFAHYVGAEYAVMVNSGSSADLLVALAMQSYGEVLVPAVTWPTHVWSWEMAGARVKLIDVDGLNTTAEILEAAITRDTVGMSLVHLMGVPCDMEPITKLAEAHGLWITEDCCEALGSVYGDEQVGAFGLASSWSFFFSHHMTTMEGGMVTTPSARIAEKLRTLRSHGWARHLADPPRGTDPRYTFVDWGLNVRPTEMAAAIGLVQLQHLTERNQRRIANYQAFEWIIGDNPRVKLPTVPDQAAPSWFGVPMMVDDRDGLAEYLEGHGVETRPILGGNLARQPGFERHGFSPEGLRGADRVHDHGLYVGLHGIPDYDVAPVAELVRQWAS